MSVVPARLWSPDPLDVCSVLWVCCGFCADDSKKMCLWGFPVKCIQCSFGAVKGDLSKETPHGLRSSEGQSGWSMFISMCFMNHQWFKVPLVPQCLSTCWKKLSMTRGSEAEIGEQRKAAEILEFSVVFCWNKRNRVVSCNSMLLEVCSHTIHPFHFLV